MQGSRSFFVLLVGLAAGGDAAVESTPGEALDAPAAALGYTLSAAWDGSKVAGETPTRLWLRPAAGGGGLYIDVEAVLYNDPARPKFDAGPYELIWAGEVVEVYFANEEGRYTQVQLGPWGHYNVLLLAGRRDYVGKLLAVRYTASQDLKARLWSGTAFLPADYLPANVTKFNVFSMHGSCPARRHEALYPAGGGGGAGEPDFHQLDTYRPIDLAGRLALTPPADYSKVWQEALAGRTYREFVVNSAWDGGPLVPADHRPAVVTVLRGHDDTYVAVHVHAPYFDDPPPLGSGGSFHGLWRYESLEVFFANAEGRMLQVVLGPHGQYYVLLLAGPHDDLEHGSTLSHYEVRLDRTRGEWHGLARLPASYFPPNVTLFNAYLTHGFGRQEDRHYEAVFEVPGTRPRYHSYQHFGEIDMGEILYQERYDGLSDVWRAALKGSRPKKEA